MSAFIITTPEELKRLVREAVREERALESAPEEVLTADGACKVLKITRPTLRKRIKEDGLPVHNCGGHPRFRRSELLEWAKGNS